MVSKSAFIVVCGSMAALAAAPGARAQDVIPPKVYSTTPGGINLSDGSFVHVVTDLSIGPLQLARYHVPGQKKPNDPFIGKNMSHSFDIYVAPNRRSVQDPYRPIVHIGNSASGVYEQSRTNLTSVNSFNMDAERSGILAFSGGNYVYTDRTGTIYTFTSSIPAAGVPWISQRVSQIAFPDGRTQTFSYNASKQLKLVADSSGYAIVFDYNAAGDVSVACGFNTAQTYVSVSSTCTGATLKVAYGYDTNGVLVSVTDVQGQATTYGGSAITLTCLQPPGYGACKVSMMYSGDRVYQQTMADGAVWNINPGTPDVNDPEGAPTFDGDSSGSVTDPNSKTTSFTFTKTAPYTMTDPNGGLTQYRFQGGMLFNYTGAPYHDGTMLTEATLPEGNKYLAEYLGPFRSVTRETMVAKPGSGLANLVKEYGYGSCFTTGTYQNCAKPIWIKDPKGNQTDFTYASHGGLLSEMQPAPSSGAARPLKLVTYVQKYAYVKNSGGSLMAASTPVWLPDTETQCQTYAGSSTATCDTAAPITVITYEYGANGTADNLRVRGKVVSSGGVNLRTCYGYDWRGNKIWETSPRAGLAVCQ